MRRDECITLRGGGRPHRRLPPELGPPAGFAPVSVTRPRGKLSLVPPQVGSLLNRPVSRGNPRLSRSQTHPRRKSDRIESNVRKNDVLGLVRPRPGAAFTPLSKGHFPCPHTGFGICGDLGKIPCPVRHFPHGDSVSPCGSIVTAPAAPRLRFPFVTPCEVAEGWDTTRRGTGCLPAQDRVAETWEKHGAACTVAARARWHLKGRGHMRLWVQALVTPDPRPTAR